jgi:hypothetical protein
MAIVIDVIHATNAEKFWTLLSPEKPLFPRPCKLLYRGQADERWNLTPSILRKGMAKTSDTQVLKEWLYVKQFVEHCDSIGLSIPNDSPNFREQFLKQDSPNGPGGCWVDTSVWPPSEMHPLLALGQHYRLVTRLLDWSTRAHVAAYFAVHDVLAGKAAIDTTRLAVWVLNIEKIAAFPKLKVVKAPGGSNANLAAQSGLFTVLEQEGGRGRPFDEETALDLYFANQTLLPPLRKITLPISEARSVLDLCALYGVTGATLFPDYYGAAQASDDVLSTTPPVGVLSIWDI